MFLFKQFYYYAYHVFSILTIWCQLEPFSWIWRGILSSPVIKIIILPQYIVMHQACKRWWKTCKLSEWSGISSVISRNKKKLEQFTANQGRKVRLLKTRLYLLQIFDLKARCQFANFFPFSNSHIKSCLLDQKLSIYAIPWLSWKTAVPISIWNRG